MKHVKAMTSVKAVRANSYENAICMFAKAFNDLIAAFGGTAPITVYFENKCIYPGLNDGTDTTTPQA